MVDRAERRKPFARARFGKRPKRARGELLRQLVVVRRTVGVAARAVGQRRQDAAVSQSDRDERLRERRRRTVERRVDVHPNARHQPNDAVVSQSIVVEGVEADAPVDDGRGRAERHAELPFERR